MGNPAAITPADSANLDQPGNQSFYYHKDHQGSVRALTNDAGAVVNSYDYDSYGNIKSSTETVPQPFRYTGQQYDAGAKLYYYRHRTYDSVTGRFLQEDPLWFGGGDLNTYRYVFNNPVNLTDPMGLSAVEYGLIRGAGAAAAGARVLYGAVGVANRRAISVVAGTGGLGAGYIVACTTNAIATYFGALLNGEQNIGMLDACNAGGQGAQVSERRGDGGSGGAGGGAMSTPAPPPGGGCHEKWDIEYNRCSSRYWKLTHMHFMGGCKQRANERLAACLRGRSGPPEWGDADEENWRNFGR